MNIKKKLNYIVILSILTLFPAMIEAQQSITGSFPNLANQQVKLIGFDGFNTYTIDSVKISDKGIFQIQFSPKDFGMAYLAAEDNKALIVILSADEDLKMTGETLAFPETIVITSGKQNQVFAQYASDHPRREQALSAWDYLEKIYRLDSLFAVCLVLK
jgi:hypothetical protein